MDDQSALPFPRQLKWFYLERVELAGFVNNSTAAIWPSLDSARHSDVTPVHKLAEAQVLLDLSIWHAMQAATLVDTAYRSFLHEQERTCLIELRSEQVHDWYNASDCEARQLYYAAARRINQEAERLGHKCGALWTVRHLVSRLHSRPLSRSDASD